MNAYLTLFSGFDKFNKNEGNNISRFDYANGYCLYVFSLNDHTDQDQLPLIKRGASRLELRFSSPLPEAVTLICYASFPTILKVDQSRNVEM